MAEPYRIIEGNDAKKPNVAPTETKSRAHSLSSNDGDVQAKKPVKLEPANMKENNNPLRTTPKTARRSIIMHRTVGFDAPASPPSVRMDLSPRKKLSDASDSSENEKTRKFSVEGDRVEDGRSTRTAQVKEPIKAVINENEEEKIEETDVKPASHVKTEEKDTNMMIKDAIPALHVESEQKEIPHIKVEQKEDTKMEEREDQHVEKEQNIEETKRDTVSASPTVSEEENSHAKQGDRSMSLSPQIIISGDEVTSPSIAVTSPPTEGKTSEVPMVHLRRDTIAELGDSFLVVSSRIHSPSTLPGSRKMCDSGTIAAPIPSPSDTMIDVVSPPEITTHTPPYKEVQTTNGEHHLLRSGVNTNHLTSSRHDKDPERLKRGVSFTPGLQAAQKSMPNMDALSSLQDRPKLERRKTATLMDMTNGHNKDKDLDSNANTPQTARSPSTRLRIAKSFTARITRRASTAATPADTLTVLWLHPKTNKIQRFALPFGNIQIGRKHEGNQIVVRSKYISHAQCRLQLASLGGDKLLRIFDLESTTGTFVNGEKLDAGTGRILLHGDRLRLGKTLMLITEEKLHFTNPTKQGMGYKKSSKMFTNWKKKYYVLFNQILFWWSKESEKTEGMYPHGMIDLDGVMLDEEEARGISLTTTSRVRYSLRFETEEERKGWVEVIRAAS